MGKRWTTKEIRFSESQIHQLEKNPNVLHVSGRSVAYQPAFKLAAINSYEAGKTPMEIFLEAGINVDAIGRRIPNSCIHRWRKIYASQGEVGLLEDQRGKGSAEGGRPVVDLTVEKKLERAEARIKLLEAENDFLKKLEALERQAKQSKR